MKPWWPGPLSYDTLVSKKHFVLNAIKHLYNSNPVIDKTISTLLSTQVSEGFPIVGIANTVLYTSLDIGRDLLRC